MEIIESQRAGGGEEHGGARGRHTEEVIKCGLEPSAFVDGLCVAIDPEADTPEEYIFYALLFFFFFLPVPYPVNSGK